jgi:hypothetical protein
MRGGGLGIERAASLILLTMDVSASRLSRNERPGTGSTDVSAHGGRSTGLTSAHAASLQGLIQATGEDDHDAELGRTGTPRLTSIVLLFPLPCSIFMT